MITHNRAHLISESIHSVLRQSHPVHELIIIDDGSTDLTRETVNAFNDSRIKYFHFERIGRLPVLRNLASQRAAGDYHAFIDSDDIWHREKIERCIQAANEPAEIVLADCLEFDEKSYATVSKGFQVNHVAENELKEILISKNVPLTYGSNIFYASELWAKLKFDESLHTGDHDFVLQAVYNYRSAYIPEVLNYIRKHPGSMTKNPRHRFVALLEFNRTLDKLRDHHLLSSRDYKKARARNLYNLSLEYASVPGKTSWRYLWLALSEELNATWFFRILKVKFRFMFFSRMRTSH
jgi:glycosyltransferase involved in cell wall biosynthesis